MNDSGLEPRLLGPNLHIVGADKGKVEFSLRIARDHTNRLGILHGGTIASMVDLGGSLAVASMGLFATGVTTDMNITYLSSGGKIGDNLRGVAECDKMGKTLAFTTVSFYNGKGELTARGSHTKYIVQAVKDSVPYTPPEGIQPYDTSVLNLLAEKEALQERERRRFQEWKEQEKQLFEDWKQWQRGIGIQPETRLDLLTEKGHKDFQDWKELQKERWEKWKRQDRDHYFGG
ncbi:HotDog domain-containing protein [Lasiosphaeria hispida]|uniref:HotDog domain-containing protein n=1 Tax=Lasiosphaeria hispida TaxID=260671 RepID=A0AAJ0HDA1_9PEZI|nr:HotDog domain-containing protein [Lasiosphaeria hispida]